MTGPTVCLLPCAPGIPAAVYTGCIINLVWVDAATLLPLMLDAADRSLRTGRVRRLFVLTFFCVAVTATLPGRCVSTACST